MDALFERPDRGSHEALATVHGQRQTDVRAQQGEVLDDGGDVPGLSGIGPQMLAPRRDVVEELVHSHTSTSWTGRGAQVRRFALFDANLGTGTLARAGMHLDPRHRSDACQGLTAKAEGANVVEILDRRDLARSVLPERQHRVVGGHAVAVVFDFYQAPPAGFDANVDAGSSCIESVLHQLLDDGCGTLHDLARRDAIDDRAVEHANGSHAWILLDGAARVATVTLAGAPMACNNDDRYRLLAAPSQPLHDAQRARRTVEVADDENSGHRAQPAHGGRIRTLRHQLAGWISQNRRQ